VNVLIPSYGRGDPIRGLAPVIRHLQITRILGMSSGAGSSTGCGPARFGARARCARIAGRTLPGRVLLVHSNTAANALAARFLVSCFSFYNSPDIHIPHYWKHTRAQKKPPCRPVPPPPPAVPPLARAYNPSRIHPRASPGPCKPSTKVNPWDGSAESFLKPQKIFA